MAELQGFLEQLVEAGIIPSLEQIEIGEEVKGKLESFLGVSQEEYDQIKADYDEMSKRRSGQDEKLRLLSEENKALKQARKSAESNTGDVSAQYQQMLAEMRTEMDSAYGEKLDEVLGLLQSQTQKAQQLEAKVARQDAINRLASEYPVFKDPKFQALVPETADESLLRERAELLTALKQETEAMTVEQIRDGFIPATAPPRVIPGKQSTLERELASINTRRDSGEINYQQAAKEMDNVMKMYAGER